MLRWQRWEGVADTFAMLDDFVRDLETAKNIPAAGELRVLARELRERVLSVKDDPDAWLPALQYVTGAGWQRLELLLTRLVEENAATLSTAALGSLRIAAGRISNQFFTFQRFIDLLLPGLLLFDRPHSYLATPTCRLNWASLTAPWSLRCLPIRRSTRCRSGALPPAPPWCNCKQGWTGYRLRQPVYPARRGPHLVSNL